MLFVVTRQLMMPPLRMPATLGWEKSFSLFSMRLTQPTAKKIFDFYLASQHRQTKTKRCLPFQRCI